MKTYRGWNRFRDRFASALDVGTNRKIEIYTQLSTSATVKDLVYWLQILFSAGIATLGLVLNSSAVIIGAMLISPLMAPILSQGLALSTGDLTLGVRSFANLFLSTILGVVFPLILVTLLPFKNMTPEILARTEPNTLDLVIALFSGAIGSIATCRAVKGIVMSIPGVAIAVALMPPLCVVGYGLAFALTVDSSKGWETAKGGGLLYLTNLVAITFTAMLVFVLLRIDTTKVRDAVREWRDGDPESRWWLSQIDRFPALGKARKVRSFSLRLLMILLPLLIIFFPLSQSFSRLRTKFTQQQVQNERNRRARSIWKDKYELDSEGNIRSYLDELRIDENEGKLLVLLRVFNNVPYTQGERNQYISLLAAELNRKSNTISLQLIEIPTSERDRVKPIVETTPTQLTVAQRQANYRQSIDEALTGFKLTSPALMIDYSFTTNSNGGTNLHIYYLSSRNIEGDGKNALQNEVTRRLNLPNLELIFTRVSSESKEISFKRNSDEPSDSTLDDIDSAARELRQHQSLGLRIYLKSELENKTVTDARRKALKNLFEQIHSIAEDRIVFEETDAEDLAETYQIFIRK